MFVIRLGFCSLELVQNWKITRGGHSHGLCSQTVTAIGQWSTIKAPPPPPPPWHTKGAGLQIGPKVKGSRSFKITIKRSRMIFANQLSWDVNDQSPHPPPPQKGAVNGQSPPTPHPKRVWSTVKAPPPTPPPPQKGAVNGQSPPTPHPKRVWSTVKAPTPPPPKRVWSTVKVRSEKRSTLTTAGRSVEWLNNSPQFVTRALLGRLGSNGKL